MNFKNLSNDSNCILEIVKVSELKRSFIFIIVELIRVDSFYTYPSRFIVHILLIVDITVLYKL